jgi:nudix-type nucleoside diphosphatase (YffH/AdpP family)
MKDQNKIKLNYFHNQLYPQQSNFRLSKKTILGLPKEVYDRGNGSAILLYNTKQKTVILTRQFRLPTYLNGNKTGMMIEVCAGMLDQDNAEQCVIRETEEEGYRLTTTSYGNLYVSWRRN